MDDPSFDTLKSCTSFVMAEIAPVMAFRNRYDGAVARLGLCKLVMA
jgi:hypothetical protein